MEQGLSHKFMATPVNNQLFYTTDNISGKKNYQVLPDYNVGNGITKATQADYASAPADLVSQIGKASSYSLENGNMVGNASLQENQTPQQLAQNSTVLAARQAGKPVDVNAVSQMNGPAGSNFAPITQGAPTGTNLPTLANGQAAGGLQMPAGEAGKSVYDPISGKQVSPSEAAFNATKASGAVPPAGAGAAGAAVNEQIKKNTPPSPAATTTPNIENFFATNPTVQQQTQELMDFLSPPAQQQAFLDEAAKIKADKDILAGLNLQDMNIENIKAGTSDDIRKEIQATGGMGTESQIMALTAARNNLLIKDQNILRQKMAFQQNLINNEVSLLADEKQLAAQQFSQRSAVYQMVQKNQQDIINANKESIKTLISLPGGLAMYANNFEQSSYADQIMGFAPGTIDQLAFKQQADLALEQQQIKQDQEQQQFENQIKLENLGIDKAQLGIAQYNAQTSRMNANTSAANSQKEEQGMSESDLIAYAQQYAATGNIPTGIPKGTFGAISQVAGALPKAPGTIVSAQTGVVPPSNAFSSTQSDGVSATYNLITNVLPSLKTAFNEVSTNPATGLFNALRLRTGDVTNYNSQRTSFLNALLMANSGKVVSETELKRYQGLIPSLSTLRKGNGNKQLDQLQKELTDKFNSYLANNQLNIVGYDPKNPTKMDIGDASKFDQP